MMNFLVRKTPKFAFDLSHSLFGLEKFAELLLAIKLATIHNSSLSARSHHRYHNEKFEGKSELRMMDDFFVTVSDGNGGEQTILLWVPLAITAYNVVLEYGGSQQVAERASAAVIHYGKEIDYQQRLTVRRQVIMAARKAADAVIEELGNGDVAAAVLDAVRVGGEILASAKASGIVIDALATSTPETEPAAGGDNDSSSSNHIYIALIKPMGIVFEPIGDPQECGVRIREIPRGGKAYLSKELKVGDELISINDTKMSNLTFYEILEFISEEDDQNQFNLIFQRQDTKEMKAAMGRRFRNLIKRSASSNNTKIAEQRDDAVPSSTAPPPAQGLPNLKDLKAKKSFSFFGKAYPSLTSPCAESDGSLHSVMQLLGCADLYGHSSGHYSLGSMSDYSSFDEDSIALRGVPE
jgi:hypothetical protein